MMTSKEAINLFKQYSYKYEDKVKALEILEKLVDRDTPKEIYNPYGDEPLCPNCHDEAESYTTFCKKCGQRLLWKEEKE